MKHVMIDLETLDTETTAHVLSIGAVLFDPDTGTVGDLGDDTAFYTVVNLKPQPGRTISASTVEWWTRQSAAAQDEVFRNPLADALAVAVLNLNVWLANEIASPRQLTYFWACDPGFDLAILKSCLVGAGAWPAWRYYQGRSMRTICHAAWGEEGSKAGPARDPTDVAHNALDDARHQARVVCAAWQRLKEGRAALAVLRQQWVKEKEETP